MAQAAVPAAADSAMQNFQIEEESVSDEDPHQEVAHLLHGHPDHAQSIQNEPLWNRGICCVYAINFFTTFATFHLYAPRSWLLEMAICRKFYESHDPSTITWQSGWPGFIIPEHACREKNIQKDLSHIRALSTFLEPLPGMYRIKRLELSLNQAKPSSSPSHMVHWLMHMVENWWCVWEF